MTTYVEHLLEVFKCLYRTGLTLKPKKCHFAKTKVHYLGHVISRGGIHHDLDKTQKVRDFPVPAEK